MVDEYDDFGVRFSDGVNTGLFSDGSALAWGGINAAGIVDILAPIQGRLVMRGTGGIPAQTSQLTVEAGFAAVGTLQLEALDCAGNRIDVVSNGAATGPHGRTLLTLSAPGISRFRVSTPGNDDFGVNQIDAGTKTPCLAAGVALSGDSSGALGARRRSRRP